MKYGEMVMKIIETIDLFENMDKVHMDISDMACVSLGQEWNAKDVCSVFSRIYMIMKGTAKIVCGDKIIDLEPGNIYVIPAGVKFSYSCEKYMEKIYFHFSILLPDYQELFNEFSQCIIIKNQTKLIKDIRQKISENKISNIFAIKAALYDIALKCILTEPKADEININYSEPVIKIKNYIETNLSASLTVTQIADNMFISTSKLQKLFKKEMGKPVGKYIDDSLMYIAEREVRRGEYSLNEISSMLGFCDQFYFSRRFCERFGISPLKYRKRFML